MLHAHSYTQIFNYLNFEPSINRRKHRNLCSPKNHVGVAPSKDGVVSAGTIP